MKKILIHNEDFSLWQMTGEEELKEIVRFVLTVNYKHHLEENFPVDELDVLFSEDLKGINDSIYYVIYDSDGGMVGTIKSQRWDSKVRLCIEKDFDIDLHSLVKSQSVEPEEVFHIGRFAIDQNKIADNKALKRHRIAFLKILLLHALKPVCQGKGSKLALCECDEKLYVGLKRMGMNVKPIGESKVYMGSRTIPVYSNNLGLQSFVQQNNHLCYV